MKKIKVLSTISLVTTLLGLGMSLTLPWNASMVCAEDLTIQPGKTVDANPIAPHPDDFNAENSIVDQQPKIGHTNNPTYLPDGTWEMLNANDGAYNGSDSTAFRRSFDTTQPFSVAADATIKSNDNYHFESDFAGLVVTTAEAKDIASTQDVKFQSHGGFAKTGAVRWQTTVGTNPLRRNLEDTIQYPSIIPWRPEIKGWLHEDYIHITDDDTKIGDNYKDFYTRSDDKNHKPITRHYEISYAAGKDRNITYTVSDDAGLVMSVTKQLPSDIKQVYIGMLGQSQGSSDTHDIIRMKLTGISGTYEHTQTTVQFEDKNGHTLGLSAATINSIVGEKLSVDGNGQQNWKAPKINNYDLYGSGANRTITTRQNPADNVIHVKYDTVAGDLPYTVVDDDQNGTQISAGLTSKKIGDAYAYTTNQLGAIVLPEYTEAVSVDNGSGTVKADSQNTVTNDPVVVHVKHKTQVDGQQITRGVIYKMADGITLTPPQSVSQKLTLNKKLDLYLQSQNPDYKPTYELAKKADVFNTPKLEGYEPDIDVVDPNDEKFGTDSPASSYVTVTYSGLFKLNAPEVDFGTVHYGDRVFDGADAKAAATIKDDLDVVNTNPKNKDAQWHLYAQLDKNFMIGNPSLTIATKNVTDDMKTNIISWNTVTNQEDKNNPGVYRIIRPEDSNNAQAMGLKFSDLRNDHIDTTLTNKQYQGTILWTLGIGPE